MVKEKRNNPSVPNLLSSGLGCVCCQDGDDSIWVREDELRRKWWKPPFKAGEISQVGCQWDAFIFFHFIGFNNAGEKRHSR